MGDGADGRSATRLAAAAGEFYADLRLAPLLRQLLAHSGRLLDAVAGSVSLVDPAGDRYRKLAETGASCRLGQSFPLDEGATGQVVNARRPVVLASYRQLRVGHLPAGHPAGRGSVAAVPIWWRGDVIGANVVFAGRSRRFSAAEIDELEVLTQLAAGGIVRTVGDPAPARPLPGVRPAPASPLTRRESEVLGQLGRGLSDREVAARLVISPKTVEKHVGAVLRKTGTSSRTAAVLRAFDRGWLPAPG